MSNKTGVINELLYIDQYILKKAKARTEHVAIVIDKVQKCIWYDTRNRDNRLSENVQNIKALETLHYESYEKLETRTSD